MSGRVERRTSPTMIPIAANPSMQAGRMTVRSSSGASVSPVIETLRLSSAITKIAESARPARAGAQRTRQALASSPGLRLKYPTTEKEASASNSITPIAPMLVSQVNSLRTGSRSPAAKMTRITRASSVCVAEPMYGAPVASWTRPKNGGMTRSRPSAKK
jgi:hypothetical protein